MAKAFQNEKGFKVIELNTDECRDLRWGIPEGMVCMHCNNIIEGPVYFIVVLNDVMDKKCYDEYMSTAIYYEEDKEYEDRNFKYYCKLLNLAL
jgi:hypothetical protein